MANFFQPPVLSKKLPGEKGEIESYVQPNFILTGYSYFGVSCLCSWQFRNTAVDVSLFTFLPLPLLSPTLRVSALSRPAVPRPSSSPPPPRPSLHWGTHNSSVSILSILILRSRFSLSWIFSMNSVFPVLDAKWEILPNQMVNHLHGHVCPFQHNGYAAECRQCIQHLP